MIVGGMISSISIGVGVVVGVVVVVASVLTSVSIAVPKIFNQIVVIDFV